MSPTCDERQITIERKYTMAKFSKELLESANEILRDESLNIFEKNEELEEMLMDEGYDLDDMMDLLFALA